MPHKEQLPNSRRDPVSRMILGPWENSIVFLNCGYPARTHPFDSEEGPCLAGKGFRGHACRFGLAGATYLYLKSKTSPSTQQHFPKENYGRLKSHININISSHPSRTIPFAHRYRNYLNASKILPQSPEA